MISLVKMILLEDKQHKLEYVTCNEDGPRNVIHLVFHNYKIPQNSPASLDLRASLMKLRSADVNNSDDVLGEDSNVNIGQIIDGDSLTKSVVIDDVNNDIFYDVSDDINNDVIILKDN